MADIERIYTIPLKGGRLVPRTKRAPWAINQVKKFVSRHFKEHSRIWIDPDLNKYLWERGKKRIPPRVRVRVIMFDEDNLVEVSLAGKEEGEEE